MRQNKVFFYLYIWNINLTLNYIVDLKTEAKAVEILDILLFKKLSEFKQFIDKNKFLYKNIINSEYISNIYGHLDKRNVLVKEIRFFASHGSRNRARNDLTNLLRYNI